MLCTSRGAQVAIGAEDKLKGLIDLVDRQAYHFLGASGEVVTPVEFPADLAAHVEARRAELVERVSHHVSPHRTWTLRGGTTQQLPVTYLIIHLFIYSITCLDKFL